MSFFLTVGRVAMGPQPEYDPTAVVVDDAGCFRDFDEGIPWDSRPAKEHSVPLSFYRVALWGEGHEPKRC